MDSRADFQRLLEDMDKVIKLKQQELSELDERLESSRSQLSEKEASELLAGKTRFDADLDDDDADSKAQQQTFNEYISEIREHYEQQIAKINEEFVECETINQKLVRENSALRNERDLIEETSAKLKDEAQLLAASLEEAQRANFELNMRLAQAESESQIQQKLLKNSNKQDQVLMDAFNDKIEALKQTIAMRDTQIKRLMAVNQFTLASLGINSFSSSDEPEEIAALRAELYSDDQPEPLETNVYVDSNNKLRVMEIVGAIRDKDKQIELLKSQLSQATKDLEQSASLLESLSKNGNSNQKRFYSNDALKSNDNSGANNEMETRCQLLENELEAKDKLLHAIESRNRYYEVILPSKIIDILNELREFFSNRNQDELATNAASEEIANLAKELNRLLDGLSAAQRLLNHIDQLKKINAAKDAHIERLVRDLNELDARCDQNHSSVDDRTSHAKSDWSQEMKPPLEESPDMDFNQLDKLEKGNRRELLSSTLLENSDGKNPLPVATNNSDDEQRQQQEGESCQTTSAKLRSDQELSVEPETAGSKTDALSNRNDQTLKSPKNGLRTEDTPSSESEHKSIEQLPIEQRSAFSKPKLGSTKISPELTKETRIDPLKKRLRQLENENKLLELAMKEILLSIRWSDSRCSTILIDCPSLERLCQLIEARFLASTRNVGVKTETKQDQHVEPPVDDEPNYSDSMFQLVVMKSELDLLRGQNEQLRTDLKLQRHEYQELLYEATLEDKIPATNFVNQVQAQPIEFQEVECQTEIESSSNTMNLETLDASSHENPKCQNCSSLVRFSRHLLESIVKIETRVNISDETYLKRMAALYQLTQRLGRDLSLRENTINHLRCQYDILNQQKLAVELQLQSFKSQLNVYQKVCPTNQYLPVNEIAHQTAPKTSRPNNNFQVITSSKDGQSQYFHSLTVRSEQRQVEVPLRDSKLTIALLQSIIGCLQARLDHKDERLHQLEEMLVAS